MVKRGLSLLLAVILMLGIMTAVPIPAFAEEAELTDSGADVDPADTGAVESLAEAGATKSQAEAVQWIKDRGNEGWWGNVNGDVYGCQCVDLIMAYYNFFGYSYMYGNACDYVSGHIPPGSNWYYSSTPVPGSIFVRGSDTLNYPYGHIGLVYAVDGATMYTVETNLVDPYDGGYDYAKAQFRARSTGFATTFINPDFFNKPSGAWIAVDKTAAYTGEPVTFTFAANDATGYNIGIDRNGTRIITEGVSSGKSYSFSEPGNYTAYVSAYNSVGYVDSNVVSFTVVDALNLGSRFTAVILYNGAGQAVVPDVSCNVAVQPYYEESKLSPDYKKQLWEFERQSDRSYTITNSYYSGKCLDVAGGSSANHTNVGIYDSNGSAAQRWYICANGNGYSLVPKCAPGSAIDLDSGVTGAGSNLQIYSFVSGGAYQLFSFRVVPSAYYTETFDNKTYELFNLDLPWKEAYLFCEQRGGHLVTVNSQAEQAFLLAFAQRYSQSDRVWLGATDAYSEGKWGWVTGDGLLYQNWASGEPNDDLNNEDYMMMYRNSGQWNDVGDIYRITDYSYSFICEYEDQLLTDFVTPLKEFNYKSSHYEVYTTVTDWQTAEKICEAKGGHLVTIGSRAENAAVFEHIMNTSLTRYWIGLSDVESEGVWKWVNGETSEFRNWTDGEPNNDNREENYAEIHSGSGTWNDIGGYYCIHVAVGFICEYDAAVTDQTSLGDADADGEVTILDATAIQRMLAELSVSSFHRKAADADGDGDVTIMDATAIQRHIAELPTNENIGKPIA